MTAPKAPEVLRQARIAAGLSRDELAKQIGISADRLAALERGEGRLHRDAVVRLSKVLGIPLQQLRGLNENVKAVSTGNPHRQPEERKEETMDQAAQPPVSAGKWLEIVLPADVFDVYRRMAEDSGKRISDIITDIAIAHACGVTESRKTKAELHRKTGDIVTALELALTTAREIHGATDA